MTKPKKSKKRINKDFDEHQGFSVDECKAVLRFFDLPNEDFFTWMGGQTCPILPNGQLGYYWYDLHRYVLWQIKGVTPVWD